MCCTFSVFVWLKLSSQWKNTHIGYKVLSHHVSVWSLISEHLLFLCTNFRLSWSHHHLGIGSIFVGLEKAPFLSLCPLALSHCTQTRHRRASEHLLFLPSDLSDSCDHSPNVFALAQVCQKTEELHLTRSVQHTPRHPSSTQLRHQSSRVLSPTYFALA